MLLRVPHDSTTLCTGKCTKISPRFCGPFKILKCIDPSTYRLNLPTGIKVHYVFHVSRLKELLGVDDNPVSIRNLDTLEYFSSKPHKPERILDSKTKRLRSKHIQEFKIKWMDGSIKDATWERQDYLKTNFSITVVGSNLW